MNLEGKIDFGNRQESNEKTIDSLKKELREYGILFPTENLIATGGTHTLASTLYEQLAKAKVSKGMKVADIVKTWPLSDIKTILAEYKTSLQTIPKTSSEKKYTTTSSSVVSPVQVKEEKTLPQDSKELKENNEQMIEKLFMDPHLIHVVAGTYGGFFVQAVSQGGEFKKKESHRSIDTTIDLTDLQSYPPDLEIRLFDRNMPRLAQPAIKDFPEGKGYGITFFKQDEVKRDAFSSYWIIVPPSDTKTGPYLEQHPNILLESFLKKFGALKSIDGSGRLDELDKTTRWYSYLEYKLRSSEFIDINKELQKK